MCDCNGEDCYADSKESNQLRNAGLLTNLLHLLLHAEVIKLPC